MKTISLSDAKTNLSKIVDRVEKFDDEITITKNGRAAAVLVSPEEYDSWKETRIITGDAEFMKEIKHAIKSAGKSARLYSLEELFDNK